MADLFHREYLYRLPLPLAQLYGRAFNAKDAARGRHDNSFYLFEAFVKLTAAPRSVRNETRITEPPNAPLC